MARELYSSTNKFHERSREMLLRAAKIQDAMSLLVDQAPLLLSTSAACEWEWEADTALNCKMALLRKKNGTHEAKPETTMPRYYIQ